MFASQWIHCIKRTQSEAYSTKSPPQSDNQQPPTNNPDNQSPPSPQPDNQEPPPLQSDNQQPTPPQPATSTPQPDNHHSIKPQLDNHEQLRTRTFTVIIGKPETYNFSSINGTMRFTRTMLQITFKSKNGEHIYYNQDLNRNTEQWLRLHVSFHHEFIP